MKRHLLDGRIEEVTALSEDFYLDHNKNRQRDAFADWVKAEDIVIKKLFDKQIQSNLTLISSITVI